MVLLSKLNPHINSVVVVHGNVSLPLGPLSESPTIPMPGLFCGPISLLLPSLVRTKMGNFSPGNNQV